jgi:hypothetical protein
MWIAFQGHRHVNVPAMSPEQLLSQSPVAKIVSDPVNFSARRNRFNVFGQQISQPTYRLIGATEIDFKIRAG